MIGCVDGPLFELKKWNPVIQSQWKKDRERGPVYSQRVDEMRLVKAQLSSMADAEQEKWVGTIASVVDKETSIELRREAVLALTEVINRPDAASTVMKLSRDKSEKVRLEVAKSLRKNTSAETTQTLLAMASTDSNERVRLNATESLGTHRTNEVKDYLAKQLNVPNPAMQYSVSQALKEFTGQDFRGDVSMWKRYLGGEAVEPVSPSLAETIQSYLPFRR